MLYKANKIIQTQGISNFFGVLSYNLSGEKYELPLVLYIKLPSYVYRKT